MMFLCIYCFREHMLIITGRSRSGKTSRAFYHIKQWLRVKPEIKILYIDLNSSSPASIAIKYHLLEDPIRIISFKNGELDEALLRKTIEEERTVNGLDVVCIDTIGLMKKKLSTESTYWNTQQNIRMLSRISKEYKITFISVVNVEVVPKVGKILLTEQVIDD